MHSRSRTVWRISCLQHFSVFLFLSVAAECLCATARHTTSAINFTQFGYKFAFNSSLTIKSTPAISSPLYSTADTAGMQSKVEM